MNKNFLITVGAGIGLIILTGGCTGTKFRSSTASSELDKLAPGCHGRFQSLGFVKSAEHTFTKNIFRPCSNYGVGYIESEVVIVVNGDEEQSCPETQKITEQLEMAKSGLELPQGQEAAAWHPLFEAHVIEGPAHCSLAARCGTASQTPQTALGRYAYLKKCEGSVPAFKTFLDSIRKIENCPTSVNGLVASYQVCVFNSFQGSNLVGYSPQVNFQGLLSDSETSPDIITGRLLTKIDDLGLPEIQNQVHAACPSNPLSIPPIDTVCTNGCYRGDQRIMISSLGQYEDIKSARESKLRTVATLSPQSSLGNPSFIDAPVGHFTASLKDSAETLLNFSTASGSHLVVTTNHPLVDGEGVMREASHFHVGEPLVRVDGRADPIVSIEQEHFFGKVYNVAPVSLEPEGNLVVSEGIINGSHNFQTLLHTMINHQILRSNLAQGF